MHLNLHHLIQRDHLSNTPPLFNLLMDCLYLVMSIHIFLENVLQIFEPIVLYSNIHLIKYQNYSIISLSDLSF